MLWLGTFLDMVSTYYLSVLHGEKFREVNQAFTPGAADFYVINAVFLTILSAAVLFVLIDLRTTRKYIKETGFLFFLKEMASKKFYRKEDFVGLKAVSFVSILVTVGSMGGARFLAFVNNVMEFYADLGFMRIFISTFSLPDQLAVTTAFLVTTFAFFPITYWMLRSAVR